MSALGIGPSYIGTVDEESTLNNNSNLVELDVVGRPLTHANSVVKEMSLSIPQRMYEEDNCVVRDIFSAPLVHAQRIEQIRSRLSARENARSDSDNAFDNHRADFEPSAARYPASRAKPVLEVTEVISSGEGAFNWRYLVKISVFVVSFAVLVFLGLGIGWTMSSGLYSGETHNYSVRAGESLWTLASGIDSNRPIEDIIEDIRSLNSLENDLIFTGQVLELPTQ